MRVPKSSYFSWFLVFLLSIGFVCCLDPIFLTTLPDYEAGHVVLETSNPTVADGVQSETTTFSFTGIFPTQPQLAISIGYLESVFTKTINNDVYFLDLEITSVQNTQSTIEFRRRQNKVSIMKISYVAVASNFFLYVSHFYTDLSTNPLYTSSNQITQDFTIPYRSKSNTTNAVIVYSTTGIFMERTSNLYEYSIDISSASPSDFTVSITAGVNNKIKWIRLCAISYEKVATIIDPPNYLDMGFLNGLSGTISDSSGITAQDLGTIWAGVTDWSISDTNQKLNYEFTINHKTYTILSDAISSLKSCYIWYRKETCPDHYYLSNHICETCSHTCKTCFGPTANQCLSCLSSRTYSSSDKSCPCLEGYKDQGQKQCIEITCQPTCKSCADFDQCKDCDPGTGRQLIGTQCKCSDYLYDQYASGSLLIYCTPCHSSCKQCSSPSSNIACISCNTEKDHRNFIQSNHTCECVDGFYDTGASVCQSCHLSCSKCVIKNQCTGCNPSLGRVMNDTTKLCDCSDGYFDTQTQQQCSNCLITCQTCQSLTVCLTCPVSREIENNLCVCKERYFDDPNNIKKQCTSCHYACKTCTNELTCDSCETSLNRRLSEEQCICFQKHYDDGTNQQCYDCHNTCLTCTDGLSTSCQSCDQILNRELSLNNECVCITGYYQVDQFTLPCDICHYTCESCNGPTATDCLTCNSAKHRVTDNAGGCVCKDEYHDGGNELCQTCSYYCLTCSELNVCETCDTTTRDDSDLTLCPCLPGFYDDGQSSSCLPCHPQCKTCINGNDCDSCDTNKKLTLDKQCVCAYGTLQPTCDPCAEVCEECITTVDNCNKCNSQAKRYLSIDSGTNQGTCLCSDGYFSDGSSELCLTCHYSCQTCSKYESCDTCPQNRLLDGAYCSCKIQFYENPTNKNCLACHYSCESCSQFSVCTKCNPLKHRIVSPSTTLCICEDGFYDDQTNENQNCGICDSSCSKCTSYPQCTACDTQTKYRYLNSDQCLCIDGYYENPTTFQCESCHFSCKTCDDSSTCKTCPTGRHIDINSQQCECDPGTFNDPVTNTCQLCSYPCHQCDNNPSTCTSCLNTFDIDANLNTCSCPLSTFEHLINQVCQSCMPQCQSCESETTCLTCHTSTHNRQLQNDQCLCKSGYHDEDNTQIICQTCHYSCLTCTDSNSCVDCQHLRVITGSSSFCSCPAELYFDDGQNPTCLSCDVKCLSCKDTATNCVTCSSGNHRVLEVITTSEPIPKQYGDCICEVGYFDNNGAAKCQPCHYSCKTCVSSSACKSCDFDTAHRFLNTGPYCQCKPGYYDKTNIPICQICDVTCQACTQTATICTQCLETRQFNAVSKNCPCQQGYFEADPVAIKCQTCPYSCVSCVSLNECIDCPANSRILDQKQCKCKNHFYDVPEILECQECSDLCLECETDQDRCTLCDQLMNRVLFDNKCVCQDGWYSQFQSNQNPMCLQCPYSCERCSSAVRCTSCSIEAQRQYDVGTKLCKCKNGFYDDLTNQDCLPCPFDCETCSDALTCLSCPDQRQQSTTVPMRCECKSAYFQNGNKCEQCPPQCLTCSSLSVCTDCPSPRTLSSDDQCICPVKTYPEVNSPNCLNCQYKCKTCTNPTSCTSCEATKHRFLSGTTCKCLTGYYDQIGNEECQLCHYSCLTCQKQNQCLTCSANENRVYDSQTKICICQSGYFEESEACVRCHYSCKQCDGGTVNDCTDCQLVYQRNLVIIDINTKVCQCPTIGYYDDGSNGVCAVCDATCLTCETVNTQCQSCSTDIHFRQLNVDKCECKIGYYEFNSQPICASCSHTCVKCENSATACTECDPSKHRQNVLPTCNCETGYYDSGVSQCDKCDYRCQTCSNDLSCDTCDETNHHRTLSADTNLCQCKDRYFQQGNSLQQCINCHYSCETCNHPTLCLTCPSTRYFDTGKCLCETKFYNVPQTTLCQPCDYSCKDCTKLEQCSQCSSEAYRTFNLQTLKCTCLRGYFDTNNNQQTCQPCHVSCYSCTNINQCQSCYPDTNTKIYTNYCECLESMYIFSPKSPLPIIHLQPFYCRACHYSCQQCQIQAFYCTKCHDDSYRILQDSSCLCQSGYYDDGVNPLCIRCFDTQNCVKCSGNQQGQCLQCKSGVYMLNGQCYPSCPVYYYEDDPTWKCKSCLAFCSECDNATICNLCQTGFYIFQKDDNVTDGTNECLDACPEFYYQNTSHCHNCVSPCLRCTDKYICLDCIESYYHDTQCFPCHSACQFCNGGSQLDCISCREGYYLDQSTGACMKAVCSLNQYVHGIYGCYDCSDSFANSAECSAKSVTRCKTGYMVKDNSCISCKFIDGYTVVDGQCQQICGDGIKIHLPCDDGNKLDGDGCSGSCYIQRNWECQQNFCRLLITPTLKAQSVTKVRSQNKIIIVLSLNVGIRLSTKNFIISFVSGNTAFEYNVVALNNQYSRYSIEIEYFRSINKDKLSIKAKSPIQESRRLQQVQSISLDIELQIDLQVPIETTPPAIFYSPQVRSSFSKIAFYIFMGLHIFILLCIVVLIIMKLKLLLFVIEMYNFTVVLYLYAVFGLFNVLQLTNQACKPLQPFFYLFGTPLTGDPHILSSIQYFGYTEFMLSIIIVQVIILLVLSILKLFLSENSNSQLYIIIRYFQLAFILTFSYQILFAIIFTFKWLKFSKSLETSYSWGLAFILLTIYTMQISKFWIYSHNAWKKQMPNKIHSQTESMEIFSQKRQSAVIFENQNDEKQDNIESEPSKRQSSNPVNDPFDPFAQQQNRTQANIFSMQQKYSENPSESRTSAQLKQLQSNRKNKLSEKSSEQESQEEIIIINLFDLNPRFFKSAISVNSQDFYYVKVLHPWHLPIFCFMAPLLTSIFVFIDGPTARCLILAVMELLLIISIIILQKKTYKFWLFRTLKLLIFHVILLAIAILGAVTSISYQESTIDNHGVEIAALCLVGVGIGFNIISFIISVVKSDQFRVFQLKRKNQAILQKNARRNRLRNLGGEKDVFEYQETKKGQNIFAKHNTIDEFEHTDTKINLRIDSLQNTDQLKRGSIGIEIVDLEDMDIQEDVSPTKERLRAVLKKTKNYETGAKTKEKSNHFYSVVEQGIGRNDSTSSENKIGKILKNKNKSGEYSGEKQYGLKQKEQHNESSNNRSFNLQSTRLQESTLLKNHNQKDKSKEDRVLERKPEKVSMKNRRFLSRLQKQLQSSDKDRTVIIKKQTPYNSYDSRDNTLISDKQSIEDKLKVKKSTKNKHLIPTHQFEEEESSENQHEIQIKMEKQKEEELDNKSDDGSVREEQESEQSREERDDRDERDERDERNDRDDRDERDERDEREEKGIKQKEEHTIAKEVKNKTVNKQYYEYNKSKRIKPLKKNKKLLKNRKGGSIDKKEEQIIPKQLKQDLSEDSSLSRSSSEQKYRRVVDYVKNTNIKQTVKKISSPSNEMPVGIKTKPKSQKQKLNQNRSKQAQQLQQEVKDQMANVLKNVAKSPINRKKSPQHKLKRIDSISSIGQQLQQEFNQSAIGREQSQEISEEGDTVFKKILQDYQKYKNKKIKGNLLRKKK